MKNKIIYFVVIFLLVVGIAFAINYQVSTFSGQTDPYNITFTGKENNTEYLEIPIYSYVKNITINIEGFQIT